MDSEGNRDIFIIDITGKTVYRTLSTASIVNIPNLSLTKGIYIVKVYSNKLVGNVKLVVN